MEEWKSVKGFEDYEVSNLGNVKSLKYGKERILKHSENNGGYLSIVLSLKGKLTTKPIHILVSESFLGHVACGNKYVVNHKDFDRKNNKKDNLEIVTFRVNTNKKHLNSSSKYTGVTWFKSKNKWISQIVIKGKNKYLGLFINEYDAHLAYEKALKELLLQNQI